ncbi:MAG TPA: polysaccharide biosynthesis/export family protein [Pirellulales bacterium]|jgi:polysaccharide export outer membrane protein
MNGVLASRRTPPLRVASSALTIALLVSSVGLSRAAQPPSAALPPGTESVSPDVLGTPSATPLPNGPPADALTGPVYEGNSQAEFANLPVGPGVVEGMCPMPSPWRCGVYCGTGGACNNQTWENVRPIPWQVFAQGEYIGPARMRHVPEYRLRVGDRLGLVFRLTTIPSTTPYLLTVGDEVTIESLTSDDVQRSVVIQPDGTITLRLLGQVRVAGRSIDEVRQDLDERYRKFIRDPSITVTPIKLNTKLQELRATVDARQGQGGQQREARVTPEGTIQLPGLGSIPAQGLTLNELKREIDVRYTQLVEGFEVTPVLLERAPRYVFVVGEVRLPGRYELTGPTTLMQSIALAGGWNVGGNVNHIVVFRRDECWNLMATQLTVCKALFGHAPCPADEIWLRDSDVVVVPKRAILVVDDAISLIFTRGLYGVIPFNFTVFQGLSTGLVSPTSH